MVRQRYRHPRPLNVVRAEMLLGIPDFVRTRRGTSAQRTGIRYEAKVQDHFQELYPHYVRSPWFLYATEEYPARINYAQFDGLLIDIYRGILTIVEIKYKHTADAYFQLVNKYVPILEKFFEVKGPRIWQTAVVEVCRYFDPSIIFPCQVQRCEDISRLRAGPFFVNICRPEE